MTRNAFLGALLSLAAFSLTGCCGNGTKQSSSTANAANVQVATSQPKGACQQQCDGKCGCYKRGACSLAGSYKGTLPGADNSGCTYTIEFEKNGSLSMNCLFENPDLTPISEKGTFSFEDENRERILCTFTNAPNLRFMHLANGDILMVNENWELPELQKRYTLTRVQE